MNALNMDGICAKKARRIYVSYKQQQVMWIKTKSWLFYSCRPGKKLRGPFLLSRICSMPFTWTCVRPFGSANCQTGLISRLGVRKPSNDRLRVGLYEPVYPSNWPDWVFFLGDGFIPKGHHFSWILVQSGIAIWYRDWFCQIRRDLIGPDKPGAKSLVLSVS